MPDTQEATTAEVADVLDRAADEVTARGWCRHAPVDNKGRVCVNGAIGYAAGVTLREDRDAAHDNTLAIYHDPIARSAITKMSARDRGYFWNDSRAKDEYEVADELRRAAKDLRNGEVA